MNFFELPSDVLTKIFEYDSTYRGVYSKTLKEMLDINDVLTALVMQTDPTFGSSQNLDTCFYTIAHAFPKSQLVAAYRVHVRRSIPKRGITKPDLVQRLFWKLYPVIRPLYYNDLIASNDDTDTDSDSDSD